MSEEAKPLLEYSERTPVFCIPSEHGFEPDPGFHGATLNLAESLRRIMCDPRFYRSKDRRITIDLINEKNSDMPCNEDLHYAQFRIMVLLQ